MIKTFFFLETKILTFENTCAMLVSSSTIFYEFGINIFDL